MYKITHLERMIIEIDTTVSHGMERIDLFQFLVIPPLFVSHPLDILGLLSVPSTRNPMEVSSINSMSLLYAPINHPNTFNLAMKPTAIGSLVPRHPHMVFFKDQQNYLIRSIFQWGSSFDMSSDFVYDWLGMYGVQLSIRNRGQNSNSVAVALGLVYTL